MEKKTIGKFISALRKANGMTQKELGEKLFVSDKTVSRWECDECTPELSLIPSIAEIFGITTDELLRGERNNPDREGYHSEEMAERQKAKSDKQFKLMLDTKSRKYKNFTLVSVGVTILGLIATMIANLGFSKGLIAFCIATAFCVASEICQTCFAINARIMIDEDDEIYADRIHKANANVTKTATVVSFINILLFAFCLPLVTLIDGANFGLVFEEWLGYGSVFSVIAFFVCYVLYAMFGRKYLRTHGFITVDGEEAVLLEKNERLLRKTVLISVSIALVYVIVLSVLTSISIQKAKNGIVFNNWADFKEFIESDYDKWVEEGYSYVDIDGNKVTVIPVLPDHVQLVDSDEDYVLYLNKVYEKYINRFGEVVFEYYYNPDLYRNIWFQESEDGNIQSVTVITKQAYYEAHIGYGVNLSILFSFIAVDFAIAASVYLLLANKNKKKV